MSDRFRRVLELWISEMWKSDFKTISRIDELLVDDNTINNIGADSLDEVSLIMDIEKEYGIQISDEEANDINFRYMPLKELCEYVENKTI
jgi:acyl carrier protein